jgi:hypothetical protein
VLALFFLFFPYTVFCIPPPKAPSLTLSPYTLPHFPTQTPLDFPFEPLTLDGFTDEGPVLLNGTTLAEKWRQDTPSWVPFAAFANYLYVNQTNYSNASPFLLSTVLSEFSVTINQTFTGWSTATIPSNAFDVEGLSHCPMSQGCQDSTALVGELLAAKLLRFSTLEV